MMMMIITMSMIMMYDNYYNYLFSIYRFVLNTLIIILLLPLLGTQGICCCISLCPCMIYSPTGGFGILCIVSNYLRSQALSKYNVQEVDFFDGCRDYSPTLSICCNYICYGFHYPCSLFQLVVSIEYWKQEDLLNVATGCDDDDDNNKTRIVD